MGETSDRLVWIDCEMTGLDLGRDLLIEVAVLVTDSDLTVLGDGVDVVIGADEEQLAAMVPVVRDMHASSGLTSEVLASTVTLQEAEQQVLAYVREHVPEARKAPLCGNSIATDRGFLARDMPELDAFLHYRMVDVSSVKELARRWYPRAYYQAPKKGGGHRALADIRESVLELAYYRQTIMVPQPGPTSEQAAEVSRALGTAGGADGSGPAGRGQGGSGPAGGGPAGGGEGGAEPRLPLPSEQVPD